MSGFDSKPGTNVITLFSNYPTPKSGLGARALIHGLGARALIQGRDLVLGTNRALGPCVNMFYVGSLALNPQFQNIENALFL